MRKLIALTAVTLLVLAACGDDDDDAESTGGDAVDVVAKDFVFDPERIEAQPGETLSVHFVNEDDVEHSFTVESLDADVEAEGGEEGDVDVDIPEDGGSIEFICRYHPDQMTGTIEAGGDGAGAGTGDDDPEPTSSSTSTPPDAGY